jgi:hypothetical protein
MLDLRCHPDGCKEQFEYYVEKRYGHFCSCNNDPTDWQDTTLEFDYVDIPTGVSFEESPSGILALTGAACADEGCGLKFTSRQFGSASLSFTTTKICVPCQKASPVTGDPIPVDFAVVTEGAAGNNVTLTGKMIEVITAVSLVTDPVESEGGGTSVEDCEDLNVELGLKLVGKTKQICVFCSDGGGGEFVDGEDVEFPLNLEKVEVVEYVDFTCDPCPALAYDTQTMWVFCPGTPEASVDGVADCECIDCADEESA